MSEPKKYTQPSEGPFELAWVIMMMNTYADALESAARAVDSTGEDPGILSVLSERAAAAARVLWNIEGGEGSLCRTQAVVPSGVIAMPCGLLPTGIGEPTTVLVARSITDTLFETLFVT